MPLASGFSFYGKNRMSLIDGKDKGKRKGKVRKINTHSMSCYFKNFWDFQHEKTKCIEKDNLAGGVFF